ncbi:helix-turn-helix domain-containing protein [Archaeoglobus sp.]
MLRIVIRTDVPDECKKSRYGDSITLRRIQSYPDGKIKALIVFKSKNKYEYTLIDAHECKLVKALLDSGAMVLHAQVRKNEVLWTLVCSWDEFKKLTANLNELNLGYELVWKSNFFEDVKLSGSEFEALKLALELGYFENPKKVKLKELAEILNVSEATASNLIRKALKKVVEKSLTNYMC